MAYSVVDLIDLPRVPNSYTTTRRALSAIHRRGRCFHPNAAWQQTVSPCKLA
ncbi:uncharacterized protein BDZ99DRAFT_164899 [Mytilinidion resinicola]|uniref:Uncharacterized protein n=1 Tax=Mytilinidion resinicola TaxID=574789 RepID=A0A6A6Y5D6_9PEZI|nr:uncharacterized protein BDZ99DRAFT_164899 [Mytilinidion resinicola]KAF2803445.1 hypothetical protein BDZ99DRAFT_164899 [Mytilinidion resinicola]